MSLNAKRRRYPYPRSRVFLSVIITIFSVIFAFTLLLSDMVLVFYYFISTFILTVITFLLKRHLYALFLSENLQADKGDEEQGTSWKMLLFALLMLIGFVAIPLLLAGFISASAWFILIISLISGVSISEIILYIQANSSR